MQLTVTQIAKIMNISVDQTLLALQEAGIVYTNERPLSQQEIDRLRTVIFRYFQPGQALKKNKKEKDDTDKKPVSRLESLVLEKKIMIDTCSLMHERCEDMFRQLLPQLKKHKKKVIIPLKVIDELKKFQFCFHDPSKYRAADRGMRLCRELQDAGCLSIRGSEHDNFADNVFFVTISNYRYQHQMLLITQDRWLAYDVLQLNSFQSGGKCYPVEVMRITKKGELGMLAGEGKWCMKV